ncbi:protein hunchback-like [Homalodisca vitripennis]|uniref:protein hunchback-like n=1 Tax=Homalodisca vitripennis TaxID=197043 RepID=UPI001EEC3BA3|nr:protein hunchback-like [Homalodisca vitripennis]
MILSAEYSQDKMGSTTCLPQGVLHTPRPAMYPTYLMDPSHPWHHPLKQEPEESSVNNDSGISPSHYNSDGSVQNTSPQSYHSEARSDDSGHVDREDHQTNATLGILARPVIETPHQTTLGLLAQSQSAPATPPSPRQRSSPCSRTSPQPPSPQQQTALGYLASGVTSPHSPRVHNSPQQPSPSTSVVPQQLKPTDDNSVSSASSADIDMYYEDPLRGLQMALQRRGMMGPVPTEQPVNGEKPLQCPLCQYSTTIRSAFNNHLMSEHGEQVSCHLCDFTAENHTKLREHLKEEHGTQLGPEDETPWADEDEGVTTPKVNSQGKVKTYRCKQCEFSTVTKLEFWEHTRGHIKPERLLTCPKCPFVTEYKHHLEYHLRNHFGSKPFKCDKCSYSCVNKSMLNSHLKSHSNIYQFRCADCIYATKYCHSLKLHLRKYNHNPAMVLNPDGSPNPLPIVDVYGTRRGPKRPKKTEEMPQQPQQPAMSSLHPMFSSPYGFLPSQTIPYTYNTLMNTFHRNPLLPLASHPSIMYEEPVQPKTEPENSLYNTALNNVQQSAMNNNQEGVKEYLTRVITTQQEIVARTSYSPESPVKVENVEENSPRATAGAPLDLSRQEPEQERGKKVPSDLPTEQSSTTKSRRKGKAFKLERIAQRLQQISSDEEDCEPSPKQLRFDFSPEQPKKSTDEEVATNKTAEPEISESKSPSSPNVNFCEPASGEYKSNVSEERKERWKNVKEVYDCPYCDILFGDVVMYTMHMGYHGYQNPFTCNMCGHQTTDKVQFLLHLTRVAHN